MRSQQSQRRQLTSRNSQAPLPPPREGDGTGTRVARLSAWVRGLAEPSAFRATLRSRGLKIGGGIAAALALLLACVNLFLSTDWVEAQIAARIKEQTGRDFSVNGPMRLLFLPGPQIVISDATITGLGTRGGSAELSIAKLTVDLNFADLLSRQVDAKRIVLERPRLTLHIGHQAQAEHSDGAPASRKAQVARAEMGGYVAEPPGDLHIEDLRIVDGTVILAHTDASRKRRIQHIDARLSLSSLAAPLIGRGTFQWKHEPVDFSFEFATPADLRAKRPGRLQVAFDTGALAARFDGSVETAPRLAGKGRVSAKASSIPALLAWLRRRTDMPPTIGDGELDGLVAWTRDEITLSETRFASEHASGEGEAVITLGRPRPHIRAALAFEYLDASPFMGDADRSEGSREDTVPRVQPASDPKPPTVDWFSNAATPEASVDPGASPQAPSRAPQALGVAPPALSLALPMPEAALSRATAPPVPHKLRPVPFDADVNLNVRKARLGQLDIGSSAVGIVFRDGTLNATLSGMSLYDGDASGTLSVDASTTVPRFEGNFRLEGVQARPFLTAAAQFGMIAGRTKLTLSISGEGQDAEAIRSSLKGSGAFVVTDGAIGGIDITAFIRKLGEGTFDLRQGADAKTAFSDLGGSFTIDNGVAKTGNLKMLSPLLKVSAVGDVNLRSSTLQFLATPEILAGPEGGGANDLAGLSVPVRIEGPLDSPRIRPQIGNVFANPKSASKAVSKIGAALQKKFKGKPVGEIIGRLLGGVNAGAAVPQALAPPLSAAPQDGNIDDATNP